MILDRSPLAMYEVEEILKDIPDSERKQETDIFLKKFIKLKPVQAKKIREELEKLDLLKMKRETLIKILDNAPEDMSDLNKIFIDVSLNEEEAKQILDIIKNAS